MKEEMSVMHKRVDEGGWMKDVDEELRWGSWTKKLIPYISAYLVNWRYYLINFIFLKPNLYRFK